MSPSLGTKRSFEVSNLSNAEEGKPFKKLKIEAAATTLLSKFFFISTGPPGASKALFVNRAVASRSPVLAVIANEKNTWAECQKSHVYSPELTSEAIEVCLYWLDTGKLPSSLASAELIGESAFAAGYLLLPKLRHILITLLLKLGNQGRFAGVGSEEALFGINAVFISTPLAELNGYTIKRLATKLVETMEYTDLQSMLIGNDDIDTALKKLLYKRIPTRRKTRNVLSK